MGTSTNTYRVHLQHDERGLWMVTVPSIPGCQAEARTVAEAGKRIREALADFVADADVAQLEFERPSAKA